MGTDRFKWIFFLSVFLFIFHAIEEYITGFYAIDSHVAFVFGWFEPFLSFQSTFIFFQLLLWAFLFATYFFLLDGKWGTAVAVIIGLVFIYELDHLYKAATVGGYYPGLWTALLFPVFGFFYWRELSRVYNSKKYL